MLLGTAVVADRKVRQGCCKGRFVSVSYPKLQSHDDFELRLSIAGMVSYGCKSNMPLGLHTQ